MELSLTLSVCSYDRPSLYIRVVSGVSTDRTLATIAAAYHGILFPVLSTFAHDAEEIVKWQVEVKRLRYYSTEMVITCSPLNPQTRLLFWQTDATTDASLMGGAYLRGSEPASPVKFFILTAQEHVDRGVHQVQAARELG
ncbi:hypothetical protein BD311DRAFT_49153 [Dichomitus squalens]|uniref:Uncharacterized protein n=1 Tax=Dichomitus squalens TaxID=114155 RepID=A0A4Q9MBY2_9APHY|nr:hypothetical protein BD311DRAFT_49153 [Dichomitus squalens]